MVEETVEKSRAWPKADNKQAKEIMELLNQATHFKQLWTLSFINTFHGCYFHSCDYHWSSSDDTIDGTFTYRVIWYSWRRVPTRPQKHSTVVWPTS